MKKSLFLALILIFFQINNIAQCKGSESEIIDGLIDTYEKIEKRKRKRVAKKDEKPNDEVTVRGFTISGLNHGEGYINLDALLDWNVGFSEGLAKITVNGKSGFINRNGHIVIKPQYKLVSCFSNGLAAVKIGKKWGYIDANNELVIRAKFDAADNFSEGLALVKIGEFWGFINPQGNFAINPKYGRADSFSEGLAAVGVYDKRYVWTTHSRENGKWVDNFINKSGTFAFVKEFDGIYGKFDGGMALVGRNTGYNKGVISETYVIGRNGEELWKLNSSYITRFSNDLIVVAVSRDEDTERNKFSFLDRNGKLLTDNVYDNLDSFSEGLAVATKDGKDGFIDKTGKFIIEPIFFSAGRFSEGLAAVWKDGESGFIDKRGDWKIKLRFNSTEGFNEGFAAIENNGKIGYIDKDGKYIWNPTK